MTLIEFERTLELFGSQPKAWPQDIRLACEALLRSSKDARQLLNEYSELDTLLSDIKSPSFSGLEQRILNQELPSQQSWMDSFIRWLVPDGFNLQLWRPAAAACLPLFFGIVVGNFYSFGISEQDPALEYWDDELTLLSLNDLSSITDEIGF